jgi:flagellar motor switch protein FliM
MGGGDAYDFDAIETMIAADATSEGQSVQFQATAPLRSGSDARPEPRARGFARELSVYLSAQLRTIVDINAERRRPGTVFGVRDVERAAVCDLCGGGQESRAEVRLRAGSTARHLHDREAIRRPGNGFMKKPREISQIERRIMSKVMDRAFAALTKSWQQVFDIEIEEIAFESNAEFVQIIPGVEAAHRYLLRGSDLRAAFVHQYLLSVHAARAYARPLRNEAVGIECYLSG